MAKIASQPRRATWTPRKPGTLDKTTLLPRRRSRSLHGGARRLTRDAEQQKYSEIAALVSVTVGREQFRNAKPRFYTAWTRTGPRRRCAPGHARVPSCS